MNLNTAHQNITCLFKSYLFINHMYFEEQHNSIIQGWATSRTVS